MPARDKNAVPYLMTTPGGEAPSKEAVSDDETHFSTLKLVQTVLNEGLKALSQDYNAFDLSQTVEDKVIGETLVRQTAGRQVAYDLIAPLAAAVDSAVNKIDMKYKE